jgi:hypothetical protein
MFFKSLKKVDGVKIEGKIYFSYMVPTFIVYVSFAIFKRKLVMQTFRWWFFWMVGWLATWFGM